MSRDETILALLLLAMMAALLIGVAVYLPSGAQGGSSSATTFNSTETLTLVGHAGGGPQSGPQTSTTITEVVPPHCLIINPGCLDNCCKQG